MVAYNKPLATSGGFMANSPFNHLLNIDRFKAFSDGVIAVALTLLVLDLKLPPHLGIKNTADLWHAITQNEMQIFAYLISFWVVSQNWVNHYKTFNALTTINVPLIKINLLFLLSITFIPFPVSVMANYSIPLATIFFNASLLLSALILTWINIYIAKNCDVLFTDATSTESKQKISADFYISAINTLPIIIVAIISSIVCLFNNNLGGNIWLLLFFSPQLATILTKTLKKEVNN